MGIAVTFAPPYIYTHTMLHFHYVNDAGKRIAAAIEQEQIPFDGEAIIFIGALGICVRKILPMVSDKYTDPAVVCIDSTGRYVIPVLSGHMGGANRLSRRIAMILGAEAVITTQSDNMGLWSLDCLPHDYRWTMMPMSRQALNDAIAAFVNLRPTALVIEWDDEGTRHLRETCPPHVTLFSSLSEMESRSREGDVHFDLTIIVSPRVHADLPTALHIHFIPPCLHLGVGCQKMAPEEVADSILADIRHKGFLPEAIADIATISLKRNEPCLSRLKTLLPAADVHIYTPERLATVDVPHPSQKVYEVTGCYGVAEAAAIGPDTQRPLLIGKQKGCVGQGDTAAFYTYALAADRDLPSDGGAEGQGHIEIVGAGPGDPDLVSVRGRKFLERADLILYAGSLVPRQLTACAKQGCVVRSSAGMDLDQQFQLMKSHYNRGHLVVRLHTGDPCIYGAIQEQMAYFDQHGMRYHITPGISSFLAAAAELRSQFTIPQRCQTIILTRGEGRTPMPPKERLQLLAAHQSTMCIFLSASIVDQVQQQLLEGGYPPDTPVAACYRLTWPDQRIYRGQLKELASLLKDNNLTLTTMIVVGEAIDNRQGLSLLYDSHFTHLYRKGKP